MKISIKILGYEIASLDFESDTQESAVKPLDKGIKAMSRWWVKGMAR